MRSPLPLGTALLAALTLSTTAPRARADVAPPPGYVEACSIENQSGAGRECLSCSAYHGNFEHCAESLASYGFAQSCRTRGASVWSEVWCRASSPQAKTVPKEVLGQLDNATSHPPAPAAPLPGPTGTLPVAPVASAAVAPTATPSAAPPPAAAPPGGPPPVPPKEGCDVTPGSETAVWAPLLALGALAIGWSRRRNRR